MDITGRVIDSTVHMCTTQEKTDADKESKEGAPPARASVGAGGHMPGASPPGLPLQGQAKESGTRRLAAATAARFPLGCGGAVSGPPWPRQTSSRCRCLPSAFPSRLFPRRSPHVTPGGPPLPRLVGRIQPQCELRRASPCAGALRGVHSRGRQRQNAVCFSYPFRLLVLELGSHA